MKAREELTQAIFARDLANGRTDYTGVRFIEPICMAGYMGISETIDMLQDKKLIFDRAEFDSDFSLSGFRELQGISMIKSKARRIVSVHQTSVHSINFAGAEIGFRFFASHIKCHELLLCQAQLGTFAAKNCAGRRLDLTQCVSKESLFSEEDFKEVITTDASLGRREALLLGQLLQVRKSA